MEPVWQFLHWALKRLNPRALSALPDELDELLLELDELLELVLPDVELELDELELELVLPEELDDELDDELEAPSLGVPEQADSSAATTATRNKLTIITSLQLIVHKTIWHRIQNGLTNKNTGRMARAQFVKTFAFAGLGGLKQIVSAEPISIIRNKISGAAAINQADKNKIIHGRFRQYPAQESKPPRH